MGYGPGLVQAECQQLPLLALPKGHDGEVEHVPAISEVGVRMEKKPVGNYLEHRLDGKEDQEGILDLLLGVASRKGRPVRAACHLPQPHRHVSLALPLLLTHL